MVNYSILSSNLKRDLLRFSEGISTGLSRPQFKFIFQMIYGMLCSQSCHVSKIARALNENILLKKTIERLCRQLAAFTGYALLHNNYIKKIKACFNDRTILVVDDGDISKPCSPKMDGIYAVWDGSTGAMSMGYHMLDVTAFTAEYKSPIGVSRGGVLPG